MTPTRLETWQALLSSDQAPLRDAAAAIDPRDVTAVARLRRDHPAHFVTAALDLATARKKAAAKFPDRASSLVADTQGVEQASSIAVARHKAKRYLDRLGRATPVLDLCSGIGGDTLALAEAGLTVSAIDHDPLRAWMTRRNVGCPTACADVSLLHPGSLAIHLDPARRTSRGRSFALADYHPGPADIQHLIAGRDAGIKLSPAVNLDDLASHELAGEIEFISEAGRLVQAMLWTRRLQTHDRCATRIDDHATTTLAGSPTPPPIGPIRRYLFAIDPAVERADLLGLLCNQLDMQAIHPRLGLLTADQPTASPWLTPFELIEQLPWKGRGRNVKQWLSAHDGGIVEIKTRGKAVDPDSVQASLRGRGTTPFTVFILRWDHRLTALITRRL